MRERGENRPIGGSCRVFGWCRSLGELGQLGSDDREAAPARRMGCLLQLHGGGRLRSIHREGDMASAVHRIADGSGKSSVRRTTFGRRRRAIQDGGQQRMTESERVVLPGHQPLRRRPLDRVPLAEPLHEPAIWSALGGGEEEGLVHVRVEPCESRRDQALEVGRDLQRGTRITERLAGMGPGELEHEERVAAGRLVKAQQRRSWHGHVEPRLEQQSGGSEAQRRETDPLDVRGVERRSQSRPIEAGWLSAIAPASQKGEDRLVGQPPDRELEGVQGRAVSPLFVVDGDHEQPGASQLRQDRQQRDAERARVEDVVTLLSKEERSLERASTRRRQRGNGRLGNLAKQVAQDHVPESLLRLGRT
jgi:hypothetical protein